MKSVGPFSNCSSHFVSVPGLISCMKVQDNIVVSGDKKGQVAVWDFHKVTERSVYNTHKALTNHVRFIPSSDGAACCSAATDGTLKVGPPKQSTPAVFDRQHCLMGLDILLVGPAMLVACQPSDKVAFPASFA